MEKKLETLDDLLKKISHLSSLHLQLWSQSVAAAEGSIYTHDFLVVGVLNRSLCVLRGFATLIRDNYICAAPLVRLQLDNLLRFAASFLVENTDDFIMKVMDGERIDKMKASDGQRMTDKYLVERIEERQPGFKAIYEHGSGYVHFSHYHIFAPITGLNDSEKSISWEISDKDKKVTESQRADAIRTMISITEALLGQVAYYTEVKKSWPKMA